VGVGIGDAASASAWTSDGLWSRHTDVGQSTASHSTIDRSTTRQSRASHSIKGAATDRYITSSSNGQVSVRQSTAVYSVHSTRYTTSGTTSNAGRGTVKESEDEPAHTAPLLCDLPAVWPLGKEC
jgi:hypothetical protein